MSEENKKRKQNKHDVLFVLMTISVVMIAAFACTFINSYFTEAFLEYKEGSVVNEHDRMEAENIARILMGLVALFAFFIIFIFYKDNKKKKARDAKLKAIKEREELKKEVERARERMEQRRVEAFIKAGVDEIKNRRELDRMEEKLLRERRRREALSYENERLTQEAENRKYKNIYENYDKMDEETEEVEEQGIFGYLADFLKKIFGRKEE